MKKKTIKSLKGELKPIFSKYIRMRDCLLATGSPEWGECITCGEPKSFRELDAGHFIPKHNANLFSERGVHTQCQKCNRYEHGNQLEYRRQIVILYGEGVDLELEAEARQRKKFTVSELEGLIEYFKQQIKEMEWR